MLNSAGLTNIEELVMAGFRTDVFHFLDKDSLFLRGVIERSSYLSNCMKHISSILHLAHTDNREF